MTDQPLPTVLISESLSQAPAAWLGERARLNWTSPDEPNFDRALAEAEALVIRSYTRVDRAMLDRAPLLKVVGRAGVGLDNVDLAECHRRGIAVVHTPEANTQAVVEYVTALMLDALRPRPTLSAESDEQRFHELRKTQVGRQLDHLTLGILGFGRIGQRLAAVAHAIGMNLHACDLRPEAELRKAVDLPFEFMDQATLLAYSDVISIHVDARPDNHHLIDEAALSHLRSHALLINTSRGMVTDNHALTAWAKANPQGQVVLDVHEPEPPPPDSPLHEPPNVRLLPHIGARTDRALEHMNWVVHDVAAVLEGRSAKHAAQLT